MRTRRRALVLSSEAAGHPFRRGLRPDLRGSAAADAPRRRIGMQELREFLMAYCACFLAVSVFIF